MLQKLKSHFENIRIPHTYEILFVILLIVIALAWIIPGGEYTRVFDENLNRNIVIPTSFHYVKGKRPSCFDVFLCIQKGYVSAANILFLIIFAYSYVYTLTKNGALDAFISVLVRRLGGRVQLIIPVSMIAFGILGSTLGIFEEVYGLVPVFAVIMADLGYDILVGGSIVFLGVATGFAAATTNPFSVGIAQEIAEIPINSGIGYRVIIFLAFQTVSIWYLMRYARKVRNNPTASVLYGVELEPLPVSGKAANAEKGRMTLRQKLCLLSFAVTIVCLLYGTIVLGWYIDEIAAMFLMMMIIAGILSGYSADKIIENFIESTKAVISSVLIVGFTRGILITMQDAMIGDTVVHWLSRLLSTGSRAGAAVGMLMIQNIINFFVTGSSSQAVITMPIMAPVADLVGLNRQTAVLAYCFGDGFSDMFWPTACALECGLMGIPISRWYRFMVPLFLIMCLLQVAFIVISAYVYV